jgi:hypothetical protein
MIPALDPSPVTPTRAEPRRLSPALPAAYPPSPWRDAVAVGLAGAAALAAMAAVSVRERVPRGDDLIYERMARAPFAVHTFPFAYRIGLPWLVHVLPLGHTASFELLALAAAGAAAGFAYLLMRRLGTPRGLAAGLAVALAISPPMLLVALREGRNTDAATVAFMTAAALFAVERRLRPLAATLLVGVCFREAVVFVVPFAYALWADRLWDGAAAKRALLVGAPAAAALAALHLAIPAVGESSVPGYGGSLISQRVAVLETGLHSFATEARRILSVYGPLWLAAAAALATSRYARRGLVLVACSAAAMTFALDWGRMILLAAPAVYPAAADALTRRPRLRIPALALFGVMAIGYAVYMDRGGTLRGIIDNPPPPYPVR